MAPYNLTLALEVAATGQLVIGSCNNWSTDHRWSIKRNKSALFLTAAYLEMLSLQIFS